VIRSGWCQQKKEGLDGMSEPPVTSAADQPAARSPGTPRPPDPAQAEAAGQVLWALDLAPAREGGTPQPVLAHKVVSFDRDGRGVIVAVRTACGQRRLEGPGGCRQLRAGTLPLQRQDVHCGWEEGPDDLAHKPGAPGEGLPRRRVVNAPQSQRLPGEDEKARLAAIRDKIAASYHPASGDPGAGGRGEDGNGA
jgi:hypothetical protein